MTRCSPLAYISQGPKGLSPAEQKSSETQSQSFWGISRHNRDLHVTQQSTECLFLTLQFAVENASTTPNLIFEKSSPHRHLWQCLWRAAWSCTFHVDAQKAGWCWDALLTKQLHKIPFQFSSVHWKFQHGHGAQCNSK